MHYLSTSGNFYNQIVITGEPKNYSFRQIDEEGHHFFILTVAEHNADHFKFADELISELRKLKLNIRACTRVFETMDKSIRAFMSQGGRSNKHSYFPVYIQSPIPSELIALAEDKIEGVDLGEGIIPSRDCEWM